MFSTIVADVEASSVGIAQTKDWFYVDKAITLCVFVNHARSSKKQLGLKLVRGTKTRL